MIILAGDQYELPSGRKVKVVSILGDIVTYRVDGMLTLLPLRKSMNDFVRMVSP